MVFRRRIRRTTFQNLREFVWPRSGFVRAGTYMAYRLRRLPDQPHRVARGVFAGVLVSFTPFFGLHLLAAAALAWIMRGNILASLIATFIGNPITFPFIATVSVGLGHWMMGVDAPLSPLYLIVSFSEAGEEVYENVAAVFTNDPTQWERLGKFLHTIYLPYLVGGILPGLVVATVCYWLTIPLVRTYQRMRTNRLRARFEKRRAQMAESSGEPGDS